MGTIGRVESIWRYPVKSMQGEELDEVFMGFSGVYGDRLFAFKSSACSQGFAYLTGREANQMLRCRPRFRHPERALKPPHLAAAESMAPGVNPLFGSVEDLMVEVETPRGETFRIDDPGLIRALADGIDERHVLTLLRSDRSMTDCRPVSLFSVQNVKQLSKELGMALDKRRFRANIYLDFESESGFGEKDLVGQSLRIGSKAVISVLERDPRCKMINLDPETGESSPEVLRLVAQKHEGMAGVYAAVLVEGTVLKGDAVERLD